MLNTKDIKYYDTQKIFELNPRINIFEIMIEDTYPVVIMEDVYAHPDLVKEVCINTPVAESSLHKCIHLYNNPSRKATLDGFIDDDNYFRTLSSVLTQKLKMNIGGLEIGNENTFEFNVWDSDVINESNINGSTEPHTDNSLFTSMLYLNDEKDGQIGTGLYRHISSGVCFFPDHPEHLNWICEIEQKSEAEYVNILQENNIKELANKKTAFEDYVLEGNDEWELLYQSSGKYNSMLTFVPGMFHAPMMDYNILEKNNFNRITQVIFWDIMEQVKTNLPPVGMEQVSPGIYKKPNVQQSPKRKNK